MLISKEMLFFRSVPAEIIQVNEKVTVDLFVKRKDKLVPYLPKNSTYTEVNFSEISHLGIRKFYVRGKDRQHLERYMARYIDRILTNPEVPSKVKVNAFYVTSSQTMQQAFEDPRAEHLDNIKRSVKPMLKNIMKNESILKDLFSITQHDYYTYTHSVNVGIFATALAVRYYVDSGNKLDLNMEKLSYGYFLHDIGKSRIPLNILNKPGSLTEEEWVIMKMHPEWGYSILMETGHLTDEAAYIALQHHEQIDGSGYPFAKKGSDIHPCARICAIADTFDALTSARPYKEAIGPYDALKLMQKQSIYDFDYTLLTTFIRMLAP
ncbi:MAG TPA: HD-GYP domain-containing protein [Deltaproteobacteria bacterium]|nr:HD-GYP domain-containing protein [Deltaproteobacteria bacterium]